MPVNSTDYGQSNFAQWDFRKFHMAQDVGGQNAGGFLTSECIFLGAGPPRMADARGRDVATVVTPVGLTDNVSVNQNKLLQQVFECGARRSYFVSGRVTGSLAVSRPMFNAPSLLRVSQGSALSPALRAGRGQKPGVFPGGDDGVGVLPDLNETEVWINMQSEVFDRPLGWFMYMIDQRERPIASCYVEECMVQGHAFSFAAQGITVPENISMMFDRIVPTTVNITPGG